MAIEFDIRCRIGLPEKAIVTLCQKVFVDFFAVIDQPKIDVYPRGIDSFDFEISPNALINVQYYKTKTNSIKHENELWSCVSMNPMRTPQSLLLATAVSIVLALESKSVIIDEAGLLGRSVTINPKDLMTKYPPRNFEETAEHFAKNHGIFQPVSSQKNSQRK